MIIISINVYHNPPFLLYQLENIRNHVQSPYRVILNCNDTMFNELQDLPENVVKNPEVISKQRFHGSLVHGIYSNIIYALDNYTFDYFIVLSSRTIFYRNVNESDLINDELYSTKLNKCHTDMNTWHWPTFVNTLLAKQFLTNGRSMYATAHEGLCFRREVIVKIHHFLSDNSEITQDLIVFPFCVEEFALQTISEGDFFYLGNGPFNDVDSSDPNKYTCKIDFFDPPNQ
jgi:hypothetical protein